VLPSARMLRSTDLPGLETAGVEIGSHSHTHRQMDILPDHEVEHELSLSGRMLAETLGHSIRSFAYPHGYWRRRILPLIRRAGFDSACAVGNVLSGAHDEALTLPRLMIRAHTGADVVASWLAESGPPVAARSYRAPAFAWRQYRRATAMRTAGGPEA
jgi:peptidoglycan/xylan/chitin deacetylase (PgdA/CDA1 family)